MVGDSNQNGPQLSDEGKEGKNSSQLFDKSEQIKNSPQSLEFTNAFELNERLVDLIDSAKNREKGKAAENFLAILSSFGDTTEERQANMGQFIENEFNLEKDMGMTTMKERGIKSLVKNMNTLMKLVYKEKALSKEKGVVEAVKDFYSAEIKNTPPQVKRLLRGALREMKKIWYRMERKISRDESRREKCAEKMFEKTGVDPRLSVKERRKRRMENVAGKITVSFAEREEQRQTAVAQQGDSGIQK